LPFLYIIDDVTKWNDINELQKSNPNLGVSVSVDYLLEEIAIAEGSLSKKREFICKYANHKQNSSAALLPAEAVEKCCGDPITLESLRGSYCVAGLDLSQVRDLTSACVLAEKDGELYVVSHCWLPADKIEEASARDGVPYQIYIERGFLTPSGDAFVDYHDCYDWLVSLVEQYEIYPLKVGYDRWSAQYLIQDLVNFGYHCDDVWQGENLYGVINEAVAWVESGRLHIGDNDLLKMHMLDSALKMSQERGRGKLVKVNRGCHIDAFAALIDAFCVRQKWHSEIGEQLKNER
jgi:phage terminase large subunit-like protein